MPDLMKDPTKGIRQANIHELLEQLAKLEHDQWVYWSKDVAVRISKARSLEMLQNETIDKWRTKWVDYNLLPELEKDKDKLWAKKVLEFLKVNRESLLSILAIES